MATSKTARALVENPLTSPALRLAEKLAPQRSGLVRILTYHRLDSIERFRQQVDYLRRAYSPIRGSDLLASLRGELSLPPRALVITFDDAYVQTVEESWPVLRELDVPAVLFVPTAFPDHPERVYWWDRLRAAFRDAPASAKYEQAGKRFDFSIDKERGEAFRDARERMKRIEPARVEAETDAICARLEARPLSSDVASWAALQRVASEGFELAPHAHLHRILTRCTDEEIQEEVERSISELRARVPTSLPLFAYPAGFHDSRVLGIVRACGLQAAVTTQRGIVDVTKADPFQLFRIGIGEAAGLNTLRARLAEAWVRFGRRKQLPFDAQGGSKSRDEDPRSEDAVGEAQPQA